MEKQELQTIWSTITEAVKSQPGVNPNQIDSFFSHLQLQDVIPGFCMITAESLPMKQWVDQYYLSAIEQAFFDIYQTQLTVMTAVDAAHTLQTSDPQKTSPIPARNSLSFNNSNASAEATAPTQTPAPEPSNSGSLQLPEIDPNKIASEVVKNPLRTQGPVSIPDPLATTPEKPSVVNLASIGNLPNPFTQPKPDQKPAQVTVLDIPPINPNLTITDNSAKEESEALEVNPLGVPFVSTMTFENFVVGDNNRFAYEAALKVSKEPGKNPMLNPIFIYGKSGLGKTHLMHAIRNEVCRNQPNLTTEYVDAMALVANYADARIDSDKDKRSYRNFRERYMNADVLLIDDIQNLQGKDETLNMVFQIFNHCIDNGHQVVLSSDRAPKYIDVDERLMSRFNGGGVWDIQPYTVETRLAIIKQYLSDPSMVQIASGSTLAPEIQEYVADIAGSNVRDLRSAVLRVLSAQATLGRPIKKAEVNTILQDHFSNGATKPIDPNDVICEVAKYYHVKPEDLRGDSREYSIQHPRQVAMYLLKELLNMTLVEIGEHFKRNHSTVKNSVDKIASNKQSNLELSGDLEILVKRIREA